MIKNLSELELSKGDLVVVAMSGGVDSSVTAALLSELGCNVIGITLRLYSTDQSCGTKTCCAGRDIYDAKNVAEFLGIPHYVFDYEKQFKENVIDTFVQSYLSGETPVPCIQCNQTVKCKDLLEASKTLGAKALVTGHYVRRIIDNGKAMLLRGKDPIRDQSYFLFATTKEQLDFLRFPLGDCDKSETREYAQKIGLKIASKPDSQDICFVPSGNYMDVIRRNNASFMPGNIIDVYGNVLKQHDSIAQFTIGQRKGIGISSIDPLYVVDICGSDIIVGTKEYLYKHCVHLRDCNWLDDIHEEDNITVKLRSSQVPIAGHVKKDGNSALVMLYEKSTVAYGQACVIYKGAQVIGGGWITRI